MRIDLRNITAPIIVFCSWGDNITPPQQALDWVLDLYDDEKEIVANGQTIVYTMHQSIGHLGIFVSGKVATKEHGEFVSCMEMIDALPPGLYEAVITEVDEDTVNRDLVHGQVPVPARGAHARRHPRAWAATTPEDDARFATVARVSEINLGLYRTFAAPTVRVAGRPSRRPRRCGRCIRTGCASRMFSDQNPFMQPVKALAETVRAARRPVSAGQSVAGDGAARRRPGSPLACRAMAKSATP